MQLGAVIRVVTIPTQAERLDALRASIGEEEENFTPAETPVKAMPAGRE